MFQSLEPEFNKEKEDVKEPAKQTADVKEPPPPKSRRRNRKKKHDVSKQEQTNGSPVVGPVKPKTARKK